MTDIRCPHCGKVVTSNLARKFIGTRAVGIRYGVVPRTIERWVKAGVLPPPDRIVRNRNYWDEDRLDQHDRQSVVTAMKRTAEEAA